MPQPAFVLHRRDYQETSLLVDLLTLNEGRIRVIAKGAKRNNNPWRAVLQAFLPLQVEYGGRQDLKTLTLAEPTASPLTLSGNHLYSGFYLNELMQRVVPQHAEVTELFYAYQTALMQLSQQQQMEDILRGFEWQLLQQLGCAFDWQTEGQTGVPIDRQTVCYFDAEQGFLHTPPHDRAVPLPSALVQTLDCLNDETISLSPEQRKLCKWVMREALSPHLGNKPLRSRELFKR